MWLASVYSVASTACYIAYAIDKAAARRGARRIPERVLLLAGLLCGWPGGWLAQRRLRHKNAKTAFQVKFWLTVALNLLILAALAGLFHS